MQKNTLPVFTLIFVLNLILILRSKFTGGFCSSSLEIRLSRVNSVSLFCGFVLFSTVTPFF